AAVGDRRLPAPAIGRAALAARHDRGGEAPGPARPRAVLAATAGPVPRRVAALLGGAESGPPAASRTGRLIAGALLCCLALSGATAAGAANDLHAHIEIAQGESAAE
ncbi:M56 family peptidase, partial [Streptomyces sp. NPDC050804]